jgi:ABC-type Mn2+/Zn2+ transport system permease subunit
VIEEFLLSWPLFRDSYLAGWTLAVLLALLGVFVIVREQIFLGAALAQASTLGVALSFWIGAGFAAPESGMHDLLASTLAVAFSVAAASWTARPGAESGEDRIGWVFLIGASLSVLLLARSPHGSEEIHRVTASSIIGAGPADVWLFAGLTLAALVAAALARRRLLLLAIDPEMASAVGLRVEVWSRALAAALGLVIGLSLRASGLLYTFGLLILPALIAKEICRDLERMLWVAPTLGLAGAGVGFVLAHGWDLPPAQLTVALLGGCAALGWLVQGPLRPRNGGRSD